MKRTINIKEQLVQDNAHIGWEHEGGGKGYVTEINADVFLAVCAGGDEYCTMIDCYMNPQRKTVAEAATVPHNISVMYIFDTRKELYQWLSE